MSKKSDLSALQLLEDISGNLNKLVELIPEDVNEKQIDSDNKSTIPIQDINESLNLLKAKVTTSLVNSYSNPVLVLKKEIKDLEEDKIVKDMAIQKTLYNLGIWNSILGDLEQREKIMMNRSFKNESSVMKVIEIYPEPFQSKKNS
ncbi:hypothetical protein H8356DRAFT_1652122 [Neocallimastix lanati (nom. inval.)]|uniref:Uncharacterized protein n=1 Tax=Neocallimastix californiae TaxID=1754190 RepID=A0A1Y2D3T7_9FUNG|nr:hypothetical protein H8356DRAFT_1652122 [Neocallimastix sp. JGI-2020a]ORY53958.1 hypothetical protein LY90DRAFT_670307 [Neocallimastix californiae]|eukprot:ORY53958.1 hypothetical protein LY90DRAFT_670307 [Neocallimastix californiae]